VQRQWLPAASTTKWGPRVKLEEEEEEECRGGITWRRV
jgi:hypothetical protein